MRTVLRVAIQELRLLRRTGAALGGAVLVTLLLVVSLTLSAERHSALEEERARLSALADTQWTAQPDRHPHRVVHFGDFVFRPVSPLAAFDLGAEAYAGSVLFLEGHRQNPSNFSEAGATGAVLRFAQLTPAFVVGGLIPLLLLFVGAGAVAGERESGRLPLLASLGVNTRRLFAGKALALSLLAATLFLPAMVWLLVAARDGQDARLRTSLLLVGCGLYLLTWAVGVVLISALARSRRGALLALLGVWALLVVLLPRLGASLAPLERPAPTRLESQIAVERDLAKIGDSHNPDDPYFADLRARTLADHGVSSIKELPFNYGGLVMLEGERLTAELHERHVETLFGRLREQSAWSSLLGWATPFVALRSLSQRAAGVDLEHLLHFLRHGEARRYAMVQALNQLHVDQIQLADDRGQRLSASHWEDIPRQTITVPPLEGLRGGVGGSLGQLSLWAIGVVGGLLLLGRSR